MMSAMLEAAGPTDISLETQEAMEPLKRLMQAASFSSSHHTHQSENPQTMEATWVLWAVEIRQLSGMITEEKCPGLQYYKPSVTRPAFRPTGVKLKHPDIC